MTKNRQDVAQVLYCKLNGYAVRYRAWGENELLAIKLIATALSEAEARGLEEAANTSHDYECETPESDCCNCSVELEAWCRARAAAIRKRT